MQSRNAPPAYVHVVHATEQTRRDRYKGCVSRQTLRAQLRREATETIGQQFSRNRNGHRTISRSLFRDMILARARNDYRAIMGLPLRTV